MVWINVATMKRGYLYLRERYLISYPFKFCGLVPPAPLITPPPLHTWSDFDMYLENVFAVQTLDLLVALPTVTRLHSERICCSGLWPNDTLVYSTYR